MDDVGVDAVDVTSARRDASMVIREMFFAHEDAAALWNGWTMEVTDDAGAILFVLDMKPPNAPKSL